MSNELPILNNAPAEQTPNPPAAPTESRRGGYLYDSHGRVIRDVRLSITDRCNFRCVYCMDPHHRYMAKQQLLNLDEYLTVARACRLLGIEKMRLTGGEPTLYPKFDPLLETIGAMSFDDLAMTSNASLLTQEKIIRWTGYGLNRITFSLDSLRPDRVRALTRTRTSANSVVAGINLARAAGLTPIKVNTVIMRGINEDEIVDLANFAREHEVDLRFIEWMPLDSGRTWRRDQMITADDILESIQSVHGLVADAPRDAHETSLNYRFADGSNGRVGIIASVTRPFCGACSRLRITADGKLRPCLFSQEEWDLRPILRRGGTVDDVAAFIADAMWTKQAGHGIGEADFQPPARGMSAIGG